MSEDEPYFISQAEMVVEINRLRAENETLRRDVKTAIMGDSAELQDVKRENDKLRLELDMQQATILVPSQKDDQRRIERLDAALKEALDEAAALRADNEKLRVELNEQIASSKQLRDFIVQYSQRYGRMREALKPFAYYASQIPEDVSNTASASGTVGDLRAAAAALGETDE